MGAERSAGSTAGGRRVSVSPPEAETLLAFERRMEAANVSTSLKFGSFRYLFCFAKWGGGASLKCAADYVDNFVLIIVLYRDDCVDVVTRL